MWHQFVSFSWNVSELLLDSTASYAVWQWRFDSSLNSLQLFLVCNVLRKSSPLKSSRCLIFLSSCLKCMWYSNHAFTMHTYQANGTQFLGSIVLIVRHIYIILLIWLCKWTLPMMIIIFWEMTPCGSYKNQRFRGSYHLHLQGARVRAGYRAKL
jgi:hypothetical protein